MLTSLKSFLSALAFLAAATALILISPGDVAEGALEADAKLQSQTLGTPNQNGACVNPPPTDIPVSTDVSVCVRKVLHNNGPASPVDISIQKSAAFVPLGGQGQNECTVSPTGGLITFNNVDASETVTRDETYVINCTRPSSHLFRIQNTISVSSAGVTDPDLSNNAATSDLWVAVTAEADFGIVSQELRAADCTSPPPTVIPMSTDVTLCLVKTVHNNGPHSPSNLDIFLRATAPADCTAAPFTDTQGAFLESSVNFTLNEFYTIHCYQPSFHTFLFENFIGPSDPHVTDPVPGNDYAGIPYTVAVVADADVKITSQGVSGPASVNPGQPFTITLDKTLHNNGPSDPVDVSITTTINPPPDCTVSADPLNPTSAVLQASVPEVVTETFDASCNSPSLHVFSIENCIDPTDQHIGDPAQGNNCQTSQHSVLITAESDVKITSQTLSGPQSAGTGQPFTLTLDKTLHNNGPFEPAPVVISSTLSPPPPDCLVVPDPQNPTSADLDVSVSVDVSEIFTVTCSDPSFHDFEIENCIESSNIHLTDPDGANNCQTSQITVPILAEADVKITSQILSDPPPVLATVAIDMDTAGNAANSLTLPPQDCNTVTVGGTLDIDITADSIPGFDGISGGIAGVQFDLVYDPTKVKVTGVNNSQLLSVNTGALILDFSDAVPDTDGVFTAAAADFTGTPTALGPGVLSRITVEGVGAGIGALSLTNILVLDGLNQTYTVTNPIEAAEVAVDATCPVPPPTTSLSIDKKDSPDPVEPGANITYTITVDITGDPATDLLISDPLPPGTTFVSDSCDSDPPSGSPVNGSVVASVWSILVPGPVSGTFVCTLVVQVDAGATDGTLIVNTAEVTAQGLGTDDDQSITTVFSLPPLTFNTGDTFLLKLDKILHNNGPFGPVDVDIVQTVNAPPDCTVTPSAQNPTAATLAASVSESVQETWSASCTQPSFHIFEVENCISFTGLHITDPDLSNNCVTSTINVVIVGQADVKISSQSLSGPASGEVGQPFTLTLDKTLHNNGPTDPADVDIDLTVVGAPPDCTVIPDPQNLDSASLPASVPVDVAESFTVTCSDPSFHTIEIENCIDVTTLHTSDPDNNNNCQTSQITLPVVSLGDLEIVSQSLRAADCISPVPPVVNLHVDVTLCLAKTVHNAGPFGPVNADLDIQATAPAGCTVDPTSANGPLPALPVSVNESVQELFTIHCTVGGLHTFEFTNTITSTDLHVVDPQTADNSITTSKDIRTMEADVKITGVTIDCPDDAQTNTPFDCDVQVSVHSNGPEPVVETDVEVEISPPFDCTLTPPGTRTTRVSLTASVTQVIDFTWQVECDDFSFHLFTALADATIVDPAFDPDLSNNSGLGQDTTAVSGPTDFKVTALTVDVPANATPNVQFDVTVNLSIHNNGPLATVKGEGGAGLAAPADCTVSPGPSQLFDEVSLDTSNTVVVSKTWQLTCTTTGAHELFGCGRIGPDELHLSESNPSNNFKFTQETVDVGGDSPTIFLGSSCAVPGDPPELCGDGVDNDGDTLIDEEPDTDGDGLNDCDDDDDDNDGFTDAVEDYTGTDPLDACSDSLFNDAWPADQNNDRLVNIVDVLAFKTAFGSSVGDASYVPRTDLNADSTVNIVDILQIKPFFGDSCV